MPITQLPSPPSRADSANFSARADALFMALPNFVTEANALELNNLTQAAQVVVARDQAVAAWAASTAPTEQLASISKSLHVGAIVKAILYDTSSDSDGGAWRKRCADKSWYTEALGFTGVWGGQAASNAAGWTACGNVTGGAYQSTADGRFYTPTSSSTQTEIFRGNVREFPALVGIVVESLRVVIYDLTQTGTPMWMSFKVGYSSLSLIVCAPAGVSSIAALNGKMVVGGVAGYGLSVVDFVADTGRRYTTTPLAVYGNNIAGRNVESGYASTGIASSLIHATVLGIAVTVLDTAPIDPATGLPVPTIAVASDAGCSLILQDSTVATVTLSGYSGFLHVGFTSAALFWLHIGPDHRRIALHKSGVPKASTTTLTDYNVLSDPMAAGGFPFINSAAFSTQTISAGKEVVAGGAEGAWLFKTNPSDFAKSMQAQVTNTYNSGWLPGDIRGAWLADTTAESVTASTQISSTFTGTGVLDGWTLCPGAVNNGGVNQLDITSGGLSDLLAEFISSTLAGKSYTVTLTTITYNSFYVYQLSNISPLLITGSPGTYSFSFVAASHNVRILLAASGGSQRKIIDSISIKLAEPDRSVKNIGLVINGSLTKTAVASGAGLVAFQGFSTSNYLEQPYNANLDFGTGDFCVMGWVYPTSTAVQGIFTRCVNGAPASLLSLTLTGSTIDVYCGAASPAISFTGLPALDSWSLLMASRVSGVLYLHLNGVQIATVANTNNITNTSAILTLGKFAYSNSFPVVGRLALWRVTATAPSADQIAHIYRTELPVFKVNAQCTIAGASTAVTALAYDDVADTLHVGTSWGRSGFKDLLRIDSEATTTGNLTSLSANEGVVLTGGTSAKVYAPAMYLRDELRRKDVARKALGSIPAFFDYTATASQTAFVAPKGFKIKALYKNGTLMREATTGVYWARSNDGIQETATLSVGATVSDWISIMCVRT